MKSSAKHKHWWSSVWVWNELKIEDKASGRLAPLGKTPQSKLYHYAVIFEKFQHPEPYHLYWQHAVRNNSLWKICDWLTGENCSDKNGLGHIVCHCTWHIRGSGSFSLDDKLWVQRQHKGCFASSKRLKLCTWKWKDSKWLKTVDEIAQCMAFVCVCVCVVFFFFFCERLALTAHHVMFSAKTDKKKSDVQHKYG